MDVLGVSPLSGYECLGHLYKTQPSTLKKTSIKGGVDTSPRKRNESDANKNNNLMNALVSSIAPKYFISSNIYTCYIRFKTATWFWVNDVNVKNTFDRRWALSPVTNGVKLTPMAYASSDGYMGAAPNVSNSINLGQYNSEIIGEFSQDPSDLKHLSFWVFNDGIFPLHSQTRHSMYGIFPYIHHKSKPNVGK